MMDFLTKVWDMLNTPAAITALAGGFLWVLNRLYAKKPGWAAWEGAIITAVKYAEKAIPDNVENKAMGRLNSALQYVVRVYEESTGTKPTAKLRAELKEGIQLIHNELEQTGTLKKGPD